METAPGPERRDAAGNREPPASRGVIAFYGDWVLVLSRCGKWLITRKLFEVFAAGRSQVDGSPAAATAGQLGAWLWWLRVETTGLRDYPVLHGVN